MTGIENVGVFIREKVWLEHSQGQTFSRINNPTLSTPVILHTYPRMKTEQTECSETSAYKIQTPGNYPEESIQQDKDDLQAVDQEMGGTLLVAQLANPLNPELNPICYLLALLGAHHFLHVNRIRVKSLTLRRLMLYIYGAPILDVSRSHTTTQHSR